MFSDDVVFSKSSAVPSSEKSMTLVMFGWDESFFIISISFRADFSSCCEWFVIRFKAYFLRVDEFSTRSMLENPPTRNQNLEFRTNSSKKCFSYQRRFSQRCGICCPISRRSLACKCNFLSKYLILCYSS